MKAREEEAEEGEGGDNLHFKFHFSRFLFFAYFSLFLGIRRAARYLSLCYFYATSFYCLKWALLSTSYLLPRPRPPTSTSGPDAPVGAVIVEGPDGRAALMWAAGGVGVFVSSLITNSGVFSSQWQLSTQVSLRSAVTTFLFFVFPPLFSSRYSSLFAPPTLLLVRLTVVERDVLCRYSSGFFFPPFFVSPRLDVPWLRVCPVPPTPPPLLRLRRASCPVAQCRIDLGWSLARASP